MRRRSIFLLFLALCLILSGCGEQAAEPTRLRFADSVDVKTIEALAGKRVSITGYMATVSPLDGTYAYLLNLPYQSCPFCVPNTTQLANTIAVYAPRGKSFTYTEQAVRATGTMEVGNFTDDYGYQYGYRLINAQFEVIDLGVDRAHLWREWEKSRQDQPSPGCPPQGCERCGVCGLKDWLRREPG